MDGLPLEEIGLVGIAIMIAMLVLFTVKQRK